MILFNDYPPGHPKRTFLHNFQAFYYMAVLAGYWLSSVFNPQILDLRQRGALAVGMVMENDHIVKSRKYAIFLRLLYIYTNIIAPIQNQGFSLNVVGHIMVMGASSSLTLGREFEKASFFRFVLQSSSHSIQS